jgi:spore coat protein SA
MRIAIVLPGRLPVPATRGGAVETLTELFIQQNEIEQKFEIDVFCGYDRESHLIAKDMNMLRVKCVEPSIVEKIMFTIKRIRRKVTNIPIKTAYLSRLLKELEKEDYEKIIVENAYEYILPIKGKFPKKEIIFHVHNHIFNHDIGKNEPNNVLKACDKILVVSNYIKGYLISTTNRSFEPKIHVLKNAIDTKKFNVIDKDNLNELRVKYGVEKRDFVFLFCGRIVPEKGVKELILAFKTVLKKYPSCKLLIVGSAGSNFAYSNNKNTFIDELYSLTEEQKGKIIFTGFIHNNKLPNIYDLSNVLVVPSTCHEAAGLVITEGLASGLSIIASNIGGIPEYIDNRICRLVEVDQFFIKNLFLEMVAAIEKPLSNPTLAKEYSYNFDKTRYYTQFSKSLGSLKIET